MNLAFRDAGPPDLDLLLEMMSSLYASDGVPFDEARSRRAAIELLADRGEALGRIWLMESDGETAGYLVLAFGFSLEYGGLHGFVDELFVREPFRGAGIGSMAVEHAVAACRSRGIGAILLEVDLANPRAHALYERLQFRENRRRLMTRII